MIWIQSTTDFNQDNSSLEWWGLWFLDLGYYFKWIASFINLVYTIWLQHIHLDWGHNFDSVGRACHWLAILQSQTNYNFDMRLFTISFLTYVFLRQLHFGTAYRTCIWRSALFLLLLSNPNQVQCRPGMTFMAMGPPDAGTSLRA